MTIAVLYANLVKSLVEQVIGKHLGERLIGCVVDMQLPCTMHMQGLGLHIDGCFLSGHPAFSSYLDTVIDCPCTLIKYYDVLRTNPI